MITVIRKGMQSNIYKVFLLIVALAIAGVFSIPEIIKMTFGPSDWVMRIDKTYVSKKEYMRMVAGQEEIVTMFRSYYGNNADLFAQLMGITLDARQLAYDKLIRDVLLNDAASKLFTATHYDFIMTQLTNNPFIHQELIGLVPPSIIGSYGIEINKLRSYLRSISMAMQDFEDYVERAIARSTTLRLVQHASYAMRSEVEQELISQHSKKDFSYLSLTLESFLEQEKKKPISDDQLKQFFDEKNAYNKKYFIPEMRIATIWELEPSSYGLTVTQEEIQNYYNMHKVKLFVERPTMVEVSRIIFLDKEKAIAERDKYINAPATFEQNAERLPQFAKNTHEPAIERAAFLLKNDGDFSPVIQTDKGFQILKRISRTPQQYKPLDVVYSDIKNTIMTEKFKTIFQKDMEALKLGASREWFDQFISTKKGVKKSTIENIKRDNSAFSRLIFSMTVDSYSSYIDNKKGVVVRLDRIDPKYAPSFSSVKNDVLLDMQQERAALKMKNKLNEIEKNLDTHSLEDLSQKLQTPISRMRELTVLSLDKDRGSSQDVPIDQFLALGRTGAKKIIKSAHAGYIVQLDLIIKPSKEFLQQHFDEAMRKKRQEIFSFYEQSFIASLRRNATIKINE